jgi:hypothetical protein
MATFAGTDRYEVLSTLGQGGMGTVYCAFDRRRARRVALKVLRDPGRDSIFRFKREFRSVAGLRHPNLVRLYDLGALPDGNPFFTMELLEGRHLGTWASDAARTAARPSDDPLTQTVVVSGADERPDLPPGKLARVLADVVEGLDFLHRARKVHRDLKPTNVIVGGDGRARLLDFGIVRDLGRERGLTLGGVVGTPHYMAPEQISGDEVGPAADLYALGCLLYELLAGRPPFEGPTGQVLTAHLRDAPQRPSTFAPCDSSLEDVCLALLAKGPEKRPRTELVLRRLYALAGESRPPPAAAPPAAPQILGREAELAALCAAWEEARAGPRLVLVAGEAGAGKTALVTELAERLQARGATAWFGSCYEREQVPYKAFDALVDAAAAMLVQRGEDAFRLLPPGTPSLARLFPVLREVPALARLEPETTLRDPQAERERAVRALFALLTNLASGTPPLLVLDDLQRADVESLDVLAWVARSPGAPPCLVVGTYREEEVGPDHRLRPLLAPGERARTLPLGPLGVRAIEGIVDALAPAPLPADERARLVSEARGNPFLAVLLASGACEQGGSTVADLVAARLTRVGETARRVLETAAVAGGRIGFSLLAGVTGAPSASVADAIDELMREALLREAPGRKEDAYDLAHDRFREAVYAALPAEARRALHRRIAEELAEEEDAARAVEHWRLADEPARARDAALAAARRAERQLAFDRAAELLALASATGHAWSLDAERARALSKAGRHAEAARALDAAIAAAPGEEARDLALEAAKERLAAGDVAGGLAGLRGLLLPFRDRTDSHWFRCYLLIFARFVRIALAWLVRDLCCRFRKPAPRPAPPPEAEFRLRLYEVASAHLTVHQPLLGEVFGLRHALLSQRYEVPSHHGRARIAYSLALLGLAAQRLDRLARRQIHVGEALCGDAQDAGGLLFAQMVRGYLGLARADWESVHAAAERGEELARRAGLYGDPMLTYLHAERLAADLYAGNLPRLVALAREYVAGARARGSVSDLAWPLTILGIAHFFQGDERPGREALAEALGIVPQAPMTLVRYNVEALARYVDLWDGDAEGGLHRLRDTARRTRESGLVLPAMQAATLRLLRARLLVLRRLQGWRPPHWRWSWVGLAPASMPGLEDEALRLRAAAALSDGRPKRALRLADRAVRVAERRGARFTLAISLAARGHLRAELGLPGADLDRERAREGLASIGASGCFLLRVEGWSTP